MDDRLALSGMFGRPFGDSSVVSIARVGDVDVVSVVVLDSARLVFERVRRNDGVSSDSRALGSSSLVYLPIEGL